MTQEALKLALDALKESKTNNDTMEFHDRKNKAITAIEEALAQTELCKYGQDPKSCTSNPMDCQCAIDASLAQTQEPVVKLKTSNMLLRCHRCGCSDKLNIQIEYTTPPQRTWVGLTDKEITALFGPFPKYPSEWDDPDFYRLTQAIEAKLKQKNGYAEENT